MGLFKGMKGMMDMVKQGQEMQQQAQKDQQATTQPVDLNDPMWAPIEGITVDKYAEISAGLQKKTIMGLENVNEYVESMGVPKGAWQTVQNGFVARMGQHQPVANRYGTLLNEFMK